MPIFNDNLKEIILPVSGAKVKFLGKITYGKMLEFQEQKIENEKEAGLVMATFLISSWDLTDKDGKIIPVTIENIKNLKYNDGNFLISELNKAVTEKKTSK